MKIMLVIIAFVGTLVLVYAALNNITIGNEPDFHLKYAILIGSLVIWSGIIINKRQQLYLYLNNEPYSY